MTAGIRLKLTASAISTVTLVLGCGKDEGPKTETVKIFGTNVEVVSYTFKEEPCNFKARGLVAVNAKTMEHKCVEVVNSSRINGSVVKIKSDNPATSPINLEFTIEEEKLKKNGEPRFCMSGVLHIHSGNGSSTASYTLISKTSFAALKDVKWEDVDVALLQSCSGGLYEGP